MSVMDDVMLGFLNAPPITYEEICAFERQFHFQMPKDMRRFYLTHNGGTFPPDTVIDPERSPLAVFHPITFQDNRHIIPMDILLDWQETDGLVPMDCIPFCSDKAGNSYYICVADGDYGSIYYVDHETYDGFVEFRGCGLVADSFTDFLRKIASALQNG